MGKTWVLWWFLASVWGVARADSAKPSEAPNTILTSVDELRNGEAVLHLLTAQKTTGQPPDARRAFEFGERAQRSKNWSLACKMFGESALRPPSARVIIGYADACLRMIGDIRSRQSNSREKHIQDMHDYLSLMQSALRASAHFGGIEKSEQKRLNGNIACLN